MLAVAGLPAQTLVTFQADLSALGSVSDSGVHIVGPFNNWNPAQDSMAPLGNGRFARSLAFPAGSTVIYKFVNGNAFGPEEGVFGECAFNTYRYLRVPAADTVLPMACYGHCDSACTPAPGRRVGCVGNSITYGSNLPDVAAESYPSVLQSLQGDSVLFTNFGAPGAAVIRLAGFPYTATEQFRHLLRYNPETVLLMLGTNDSKPPIWSPYGSTFGSYYDSLCIALDTLPSQPRMVVFTPARAFGSLFGVDDAVLSQQIVPAIRKQGLLRAWDQFDMRSVTDSMGAHFPDGLHPDATATAWMAAAVHAYLQLPRPQVIGSALLSPDMPGYAWQWYLDGDTLPDSLGGKAPSVVAQQIGTYRVAVQVDSLHHHILVSDPRTIAVAVTAPAEGQVHIYPNPATEALHWEWPRSAGEMVELSLYDLQGRTVGHVRQPGPRGELPRGMLPAGVYWLGMTSMEKTVWKAVLWR